MLNQTVTNAGPPVKPMVPPLLRADLERRARRIAGAELYRLFEHYQTQQTPITPSQAALMWRVAQTVYRGVLAGEVCCD